MTHVYQEVRRSQGFTLVWSHCVVSLLMSRSVPCGVVVEISRIHQVFVLHPSDVPAKVCVDLKRRYSKMRFPAAVIGQRNRTQPAKGCQNGKKSAQTNKCNWQGTLKREVVLHCCFVLQMPACWLEVSIRKVLRPATSTHVFLGFPCVYKQMLPDGSQHSKLPLHASHVALPT